MSEKAQKIQYNGKLYGSRICLGDGVVEVLDENEKVVGKYAVKHNEMPIMPVDDMNDTHKVLNAATDIGINHILGNDWKWVGIPYTPFHKLWDNKQSKPCIIQSAPIIC